MVKILKKISNIFSLFGFNLKNFISLIYLPKYVKDFLKFSIISKNTENKSYTLQIIKIMLVTPKDITSTKIY